MTHTARERHRTTPTLALLDDFIWHYPTRVMPPDTHHARLTRDRSISLPGCDTLDGTRDARGRHEREHRSPSGRHSLPCKKVWEGTGGGSSRSWEVPIVLCS